jgi:hypothetical protein
VFENRVLGRIFGSTRDEVTGGWRKLHNEELHNLYSSPRTTRMITLIRMRSEGHVTRMGPKGNAYRTLVGKPQRKRPLGRPRRSWVNNMKMDVREIGRGGIDWIDLAQGRDRWRSLVNTVINPHVPKRMLGNS